MDKSLVSIVKYEKPLDSVRKAVDLCKGLDHLPSKAKVFIKPNIVWWTKETVFPKWGIITTSRIVEDMVVLLKELGVDEIVIGEGMVIEPKDRETPQHAFKTLGYNVLKRRYGVKCFNIHERPFEKVDIGSGAELNLNLDFLECDFLVNIPVLKTHFQTVVSLGIKNIKGLIDIESRKKCHSTEPGMDLHHYVSRLAAKIPLSLTLVDGIYSNEIGPAFKGNIRRSNLLIASPDMLAADKVGAKVLGYDPSQVPHLVLTAKDKGRPIDFSDVETVGEEVDKVATQPQAAARVRSIGVDRYEGWNVRFRIWAGMAEMYSNKRIAGAHLGVLKDRLHNLRWPQSRAEADDSVSASQSLKAAGYQTRMD